MRLRPETLGTTSRPANAVFLGLLIHLCNSDVSLMELRQLRYFATVAAHGSFSRAASYLHLTQPAVSRQVQNLEAELGTGAPAAEQQHGFADGGRGVVLRGSP